MTKPKRVKPSDLRIYAGHDLDGDLGWTIHVNTAADLINKVISRLEASEQERDSMLQNYQRLSAENWELMPGRNEAEQREQALAAHMEAAKKIFSHGSPFEVVSGGRTALAVYRDEAEDWQRASPTTSLARLKAQWQAEALDKLVERWGPLVEDDSDDFNTGWDAALRRVIGHRDSYRRQAEGDQS